MRRRHYMKTISLIVFILNKENIISTIIMSLCLSSIDDILSNNMYNTVCHISTLYCLHISPLFSTVVPALGDPVVSGHLTSTATLSMLYYLRSADTCLTRTVVYWLSVPAITDSANKCHVFGGHFNPKSLAARTLSCDRQFAQISVLPSGDRKQYFISRVNACVMNHVIGAIQTIWLHPVYDIMS